VRINLHDFDGFRYAFDRRIQRFAFGKCMLAAFRAAATGSSQLCQVATDDISVPPTTSSLDADNRFRAQP